jgi:hypothetical protein
MFGNTFNPSGGGIGGIWTPTITGIVNTAFIGAFPCYYHKIDSVVFISGQFDMQAAAIGNFQARFSLPFASAFTTDDQLSGVANGYFGGVNCTGSLLARVASGEMRIFTDAPDVGTRRYTFTAAYRIL